MEHKERTALLKGWLRDSRRIASSSPGALGVFLVEAFGARNDRQVHSRWCWGEFPEMVPDAVVAATMDAVINECSEHSLSLFDFMNVIGHKHDERGWPAFHNYTAEQARRVVSKIADLLVVNDEDALALAREHQYHDRLLAYFALRDDRSLPAEYVAAVLGS